MTRPATLRARLAALGLAGILVPLAVLVAVSFVSEEDQTSRLGTDGVVTERTRGLSPWVPATAAALAVPAAAAAWWWAGRAVVPLRRITAVADEIQATSLDRRIGVLDGPAEVEALAASFDHMLDRLAASSQVQRRLVEDASHQLRTPLAVLTTGIDLALAEPVPTVEELTAGLGTAREAANRLRGVVDDLLASAHTERRAAADVATSLADVVAEAIAAHDDLARAAGVTIGVHTAESVVVAVERGPLVRAVSALVDNALRHSPTGGRIDLAIADGPDGPSVSVTDEGPGVDPGDRERIFERYWSTAEGTDDGLGIGLAVVAQIAEAHGGIHVESPVADGTGARFTLHLGRRPPAHPRTG